MSKKKSLIRKDIRGKIHYVVCHIFYIFLNKSVDNIIKINKYIFFLNHVIDSYTNPS